MHLNTQIQVGLTPKHSFWCALTCDLRDPCLSLLTFIQILPTCRACCYFQCAPLSYPPAFVNIISSALKTLPSSHNPFIYLTPHPLSICLGATSSRKPSLDAWLGKKPPLGLNFPHQSQGLCLVVIHFSAPNSWGLGPGPLCSPLCPMLPA